MMGNLILLNLFTLALYFYIYFSVYSFSDFARLRSNGYIVLALSMVAHSGIILSADYFQSEQYVTFILMLVTMWLTFYFALEMSPSVTTFAAVRHVFYFMSSRTLVISLFSLISNIPVREVIENGRDYTYLYLIATLIAIAFTYLLRRYYLTNERLTRLLSNHSQVIFVSVVKFAMGCYLMFNAYGSHFTANDRWYSLVHLITTLLVVGVAELGLVNSVQLSGMLEYEKQTVALQKQLDLQVNHYKSYQKYTHSFREFRHDYKNTLSSVNALIRNNENEKAIRLLDNVGAHLTQGVEAHRDYSNDIFIDAILQAFVNRCIENSVTFKGVVYWNKNIQIEEFKLVRIFNNVLDNAFEAVMRLEKDNRDIEVRTHVRDFWLDVEIINSFDWQLKSSFKTTKHDYDASHGMGMKIVEQTMEEIGGLVSWIPKETKFIVRLNFPTRASKEVNS